MRHNIVSAVIGPDKAPGRCHSESFCKQRYRTFLKQRYNFLSASLGDAVVRVLART